jgi:predicted membrane protein
MTDWDKDSLRDSIKNSVHDAVRQRIDEKLRGKRTTYGVSAGIIWGVALCLLGAALLLDHLGVISTDRIWRYWPLIVVVVGIVDLMQPGRRAWGVFLILGASLYQLDSLGIVHFRWTDLWPVAIIAAGIALIWGSLDSHRVRPAPPGVEQSSMNLTAIFGGVERRITASDFRWGRITAIFGGVEMDFREANLDSDEAVVEINAIFGGVEIRVPEGWRVEARNQTVFGAYSDKTRTASINPDAPVSGGRRTLIITGTVLFGGIEVKN